MRIKLLAAVALLALLAAAYWLLHQTGALETVLNGALLRDHIARLGHGAAAGDRLMVLAIMVSPIPSGACRHGCRRRLRPCLGHALCTPGRRDRSACRFRPGALVGQGNPATLVWRALVGGLARIQNALMGIVLVSRLLPFIRSISSAMPRALTLLSFWRFAVATLVGIVPASFLLAHFGGEMARANPTASCYPCWRWAPLP